MHEAGEFDTITETWVHFALVVGDPDVTPSGISLFVDGKAPAADAITFLNNPLHPNILLSTAILQ